MIDKSKSKNYIKKIEDHFDKQAFKGSLKDFIPNCLDDYSKVLLNIFLIFTAKI